MRPFFIAGPVRCGTSLMAEILFTHGVFIGKSKATKYPETNTKLGTERIEFKPIIQELMDVNGYNKRREAPIPKDIKNIKDLRQKVSRLYPDNKPWLIKSSGLAWFYEVFKKEFPAALWILPTRPANDVVRSILNHPVMARTTPDKTKLLFYVEAMQDRQREIARAVRYGAIIDVDRLVIDKDAQGLPELMFKAGIRFKQENMENIINSNAWHSSRSAA